MVNHIAAHAAQQCPAKGVESAAANDDMVHFELLCRLYDGHPRLRVRTYKSLRIESRLSTPCEVLVAQRLPHVYCLLQLRGRFVDFGVLLPRYVLRIGLQVRFNHMEENYCIITSMKVFGVKLRGSFAVLAGVDWQKVFASHRDSSVLHSSVRSLLCIEFLPHLIGG